MTTITDIIAMKQEKNKPFGNQYSWLIQNIENDLISKSRGEERVRQMLADYDYFARLFVVHQFFHIGKDELGNTLFSILELVQDKTFLEDKYLDELLDNQSL